MFPVTTHRLDGIGMTSRRTRERMIARLRESGITDERVLSVMHLTPRHLFVEEALASRAYEHTALPIGYGQTISRPYTVARMSELLLREGRPERILEVGTGSGYQAAILAQIVSVVYTVERQTVLAKHARKLLCDIGFTNISFRLTDGSWGWSEEAPFDAILMTAAATTPPASLLDQLGSNGYLIGPLGQPDDQQLVIVRRKGAGFVQHIVEPARFVPLRPGLEN